METKLPISGEVWVVSERPTRRFSVDHSGVVGKKSPLKHSWKSTIGPLDDHFRLQAGGELHLHVNDSESTLGILQFLLDQNGELSKEPIVDHKWPNTFSAQGDAGQPGTKS